MSFVAVSKKIQKTLQCPDKWIMRNRIVGRDCQKTSVDVRLWPKGFGFEHRSFYWNHTQTARGLTEQADLRFLFDSIFNDFDWKFFKVFERPAGDQASLPKKCIKSCLARCWKLAVETIERVLRMKRCVADGVQSERFGDRSTVSMANRKFSVI